MAEVVWSDAAIADVEQIRSYIALENPLAAARVARLLVETASSLSSLPLRGRAIEDGERKLVLSPYAIFYNVEDDSQRVILNAIRDGRRRDR